MTRVQKVLNKPEQQKADKIADRVGDLAPQAPLHLLTPSWILDEVVEMQSLYKTNS